MNIDICICTFRRAHIAESLRSLAQLEKAPNWQLHIIVADNDDTPSAEALVKTTAQELGLNVLYVHAPARNISIARNACLSAATAPLVAFMDDDELATPQWLKALVNEIETSKTDVVLGPVKALYAPDTPNWMQTGDFHATLPVWVNGKIITGYTCNVLLRRNSPAIKGLTFRPELGRTGGEDTAFFDNVTKAGGKISFAQDAWLHEAVTPARASLSWLFKRRFRSGQTHGLLLLEAARFSLSARLKALTLALAKGVFCYGMAAINIWQPVRWRFWLLRGAIHHGVVRRLMGKNLLEQYG